MNNRLLEVRKKLNLTQDDLGKAIGITRGAVSKIETGERKVTDQVVKSVCREFDINEDWFRNGTGNMFIELTPDIELADAIAEVINGENPFMRKVFTAFSQLTRDQQAAIEQLIDNLKESDRIDLEK